MDKEGIMTEVEKIAYARMYIEKLANGINPLTDKAVPDTDLIRLLHVLPLLPGSNGFVLQIGLRMHRPFPVALRGFLPLQ